MKRIIKFEKEDCNPCIMVSNYLKNKSIAFEAVNPFDYPELAVKYKVRTVPTTILLKEEGELMRSIGYHPEELAQIIESLS